MKFATKTIRYNPPHRRIRRPTGLSVRYHGRRVFIGRLCSGLFVRTCVWNVSRGAVHSSWQMLTALLAWSALSFCFRSSCSMPPTLFSLRTKRCSRSLRLTVGRTKWVADCGNFWRRGLAFSSVRALLCLAACACVPQLFQQLMLIVDRHSSNVGADEFPMPQIDHQSK